MRGEGEGRRERANCERRALERAREGRGDGEEEGDHAREEEETSFGKGLQVERTRMRVQSRIAGEGQFSLVVPGADAEERMSAPEPERRPPQLAPMAERSRIAAIGQAEEVRAAMGESESEAEPRQGRAQPDGAGRCAPSAAQGEEEHHRETGRDDSAAREGQEERDEAEKQHARDAAA